jgi:UDP-glucose 4-epimerase
MNQIMQEKELTIFGDGSQSRAFSHILDVAPIIAASVLRPEAYNQVFNVGADRPVSVLELANVIGRKFKVEPKIRFLEARNEVLHAYSSHDKVRKFFGDLISGVELESGIEQMMQWARKTGPKSGKRFTGVEIEKNMPLSWKKLVG